MKPPESSPLQAAKKSRLADTVTLNDVRRRAMDLLARREHGHVELTRKLVHKGLPEDLVDDALAHLSEDGLLSDQRYCESVVNSLYQRGQGPQKIRYQLRAKGVGDEVIENALAVLSPDWEASLIQLFHKKYSGKAGRTPSERAKQVRFLSSRGFPQEMIFRLLKDGDSG